MQNGEIREPTKEALMFVGLSIVTCGLYAMYWMYRFSNDLNQALGREELNAVMWIAIGMFTCGIGYLVFFYKLGELVEKLQTERGVQPKQTGMIIFVAFLLLAPAGVYLAQEGFNNAFQGGRM